MARRTRVEMREIDAADFAEHAAYVKAKRKSELEEELALVIKHFGLAITYFDRWKVSPSSLEYTLLRVKYV